jgi:hypothetical protein
MNDLDRNRMWISASADYGREAPQQRFVRHSFMLGIEQAVASQYTHRSSPEHAVLVHPSRFAEALRGPIPGTPTSIAPKRHEAVSAAGMIIDRTYDGLRIIPSPDVGSG